MSSTNETQDKDYHMRFPHVSPNKRVESAGQKFRNGRFTIRKLALPKNTHEMRFDENIKDNTSDKFQTGNLNLEKQERRNTFKHTEDHKYETSKRVYFIYLNLGLKDFEASEQCDRYTIGNVKDISNDDSFFLKSVPTGEKHVKSHEKDSGNVDRNILSKSSSTFKNNIRSYKSDSFSSK